jgi:hypothetical protein
MSRTARVALGLILSLIGICLGQEREDVNAKVARPLILQILRKGHISGSLEYSGQCDLQRPQPDIPKVRVLLKSWGGPPIRTLSEMFVDDPKMQVTQEADGTIRMVERDVPSDLLEVKIRHLSFNDVYDPAEALKTILFAPEVRYLMREHHIAWPETSPATLRAVAPPSADLRHMSGNLDNVKVSKALDYVLRTFPGLWIYENCPGDGGRRAVFVRFYQ